MFRHLKLPWFFKNFRIFYPYFHINTGDVAHPISYRLRYGTHFKNQLRIFLIN